MKQSWVLFTVFGCALGLIFALAGMSSWEALVCTVIVMVFGGMFDDKGEA
jgi:hypothetical protein